jgi:hypothetical protein
LGIDLGTPNTLCLYSLAKGVEEFWPIFLIVDIAFGFIGPKCRRPGRRWITLMNGASGKCYLLGNFLGHINPLWPVTYAAALHFPSILGTFAMLIL